MPVHLVDHIAQNRHLQVFLSSMQIWALAKISMS
jgi:hypothetical protein